VRIWFMKDCLRAVRGLKSPENRGNCQRNVPR